MKEPELDSERIAALLARRLDGPERAAALEQLASSGDDFWTFMETASVLRRIEEEDEAADTEEEQDTPSVARNRAAEPPAAPGPPVPAVPLLLHRSQWSGSRRRWVALAAVVLLAALVPLLARRGTPARDPLAAPAALLASSADPLPRDWTERRPWEATLGSGETLSRPARAVRAGALHADLVVAMRAGDLAGVSRLAREMDGVLAAIPVSSSAAYAYREAGDAAAAGSPERGAVLLQSAGAGAGAILGKEWMEAGAWIETGRLAAARHDAGFFAAPAARAALDRVAALPGARVGVERVRAAVRAGGAARWDALQQALDELLGALAG